MASAKSKRAPGPGRTSLLSITLAVRRNRVAAIATIAVPRIMSASPASFPNFCPGAERARPAREGAASSRNRSNRSTRNPKAMTAMAVRTQARKVRSFAEWSAKFRIILSPPEWLTGAFSLPRNSLVSRWPSSGASLLLSLQHASGVLPGRRRVFCDCGWRDVWRGDELAVVVQATRQFTLVISSRLDSRVLFHRK
jgi:hypothetical protein